LIEHAQGKQAVLAENAHPFESPPLRMDNLLGYSG
jgi:hypothetical protein